MIIDDYEPSVGKLLGIILSLLICSSLAFFTVIPLQTTIDDWYFDRDAVLVEGKVLDHGLESRLRSSGGRYSSTHSYYDPWIRVEGKINKDDSTQTCTIKGQADIFGQSSAYLDHAPDSLQEAMGKAFKAGEKVRYYFLQRAGDRGADCRIFKEFRQVDIYLNLGLLLLNLFFFGLVFQALRKWWRARRMQRSGVSFYDIVD